MIRYTLRCDNDHSFESWFQSAEAFDRLAAAGQATCPSCGSHRVAKALMAPVVSDGRAAAPRPAPNANETAGERAKKTALAELRRRIETQSEHVGRAFADEARAIHEGSAPSRLIHGEANAADARRLIRDGIPVLPLPFLPKRKLN